MNEKVILITAADSDLGELATTALSHSGHIVYAAIPPSRMQRWWFDKLGQYARDQGVDIRPLSMSSSDHTSVDAAVEAIMAERHRIDVVVHNGEDLAVGPMEAFTAIRLASVIERVIMNAQRINRSVLPHMRRQGAGLLIWISSSSAAGGALPYLGPQLLARAALDAMAVQYAIEVGQWGIETTILVPGLQMHDTVRLLSAPGPDDPSRIEEYEDGSRMGLDQRLVRAVTQLLPAESDIGPVAGAIVEAVDTPEGERPLRIYIELADEGGAVAFPVIDRIRNEVLSRVGVSSRLGPRRR